MGSGISQGCPLSPYLFIMVQTIIFENLDWYLFNQGVATNTWSVGKPVYNLEYADDTLLMSTTTTQLTDMPQGLQTQAKLSGMNLNQTKTEVLQDTKRPQNTLRFRDGTPVPTTTQIKYLGSMISWDKPFETAFKHRAGIAESAYKKLRLVWNSSMPQKRKLYIFRTTFLSSLIYALDSLTLLPKHFRRIDAYFAVGSYVE